MYIEKDVGDNVDSKTIISYKYFKIWNLVKEILKIYVIVTFFFFFLVMLIYSSFIFLI